MLRNNNFVKTVIVRGATGKVNWFFCRVTCWVLFANYEECFAGSFFVALKISQIKCSWLPARCFSSLLSRLHPMGKAAAAGLLQWGLIACSSSYRWANRIVIVTIAIIVVFCWSLPQAMFVARDGELNPGPANAILKKILRGQKDISKTISDILSKRSRMDLSVSEARDRLLAVYCTKW